MKNIILFSLFTLFSLVLTGCTQSPNTDAPTTGDSNSLYTVQAEFAKQFQACESNPASCELDRDQIIEGVITKIYEPSAGELANFVDLVNSQGNSITIPLLPDTQQKRSTLIVNESGNAMAFGDISIGDKIKASVKSFDVIEAGQIAEKLGQYGYIQVMAQ